MHSASPTLPAGTAPAPAPGPGPVLARPLTPSEVAHLDRLRAWLQDDGVDVHDAAALDARWGTLLATHPAGAPAPAGVAAALGIAVGDVLVRSVPGAFWMMCPGPDGATPGVVAEGRVHMPVLAVLDAHARWRVRAPRWTVDYVRRAAAHLAAPLATVPSDAAAGAGAVGGAGVVAAGAGAARVGAAGVDAVPGPVGPAAAPDVLVTGTTAAAPRGRHAGGDEPLPVAELLATEEEAAWSAAPRDADASAPADAPAAADTAWTVDADLGWTVERESGAAHAVPGTVASELVVPELVVPELAVPELAVPEDVAPEPAASTSVTYSVDPEPTSAPAGPAAAWEPVHVAATWEPVHVAPVWEPVQPAAAGPEPEREPSDVTSAALLPDAPADGLAPLDPLSPAWRPPALAPARPAWAPVQAPTVPAADEQAPTVPEAAVPEADVVTSSTPVVPVPPVSTLTPEDLPHRPTPRVQDLALRALEHALEQAVADPEGVASFVLVREDDGFRLTSFARGSSGTLEAREHARRCGLAAAAVGWTSPADAGRPYPRVVVDASAAGEPGIRVAHAFVHDAAGGREVGGPEVVGQAAPVL